MKRATFSAVFVAALLFTHPAFADWYDDYQAGIKAAKAGNWQTVVSRMDAAIAAKPQEEQRARPYGNVFVNYRPYYYRGIAYYELGQWQRAIDDLERTGAESLDLGSKDSKIMRAREEMRGAAATPTPRPPSTPTPEPIRTPGTTPTPIRIVTPTPIITPGPITEPISVGDARQRAMRSVQTAQNDRAAALQQNAQTLARSRYGDAMSKLERAQSMMSRAQTVADWNVVASTAEGAAASFRQARAEALRPVDDVLAQTRTRVRSALEAYFDGRYEESRQQFELLATQQSSNALLWAFHGASAYSQYYIGGQRDASLRAAAEASFRKAKSLKLGELPSSYFSPRIRRFYNSLR